MILSFRAPTRRKRARRSAAGATGVAALALLLGLFAVVTPSATAGPVDDGWVATGPGAVQTVSGGSASAAAMTYNGDNLGSASWMFTTTASVASAEGPIRVPWTWQGLHAWYLVTASLDAVVIRNGVELPATSLVAEGPEICCTEPSNGFIYGGIHEFDVQAGDVYGFRLSGSNSDLNNFLRGTFTLSTRPYIDATIGTDNRQWTGAAEISTATLPVTTAGYLEEPGEARWFKFRVVPGQQATLNLTSPADYDLALYGDVGAAFDQLAGGADLAQLAAASASGAPGAETQTPVYDPSVTTIPTASTKPPVSTQFAPRIYAPRIYAPRIYAPRIYAPRIYAPRIYAPRIYAPDSFVPDLESNTFFRDAFSAAQNQTLLAMSANTDLNAETVSASTGNTDGYFYVRLQGATDEAFDAGTPFSLRLNLTGGESCRGLSTFDTTPTIGASGNPAAVIVTDTNKLMMGAGSTAQQTYLAKLGSLATRTGGVVVDVRTSPRVQALQDQVSTHPTCPYASNLVAREIQSIVERFRGDATKYVVIAGGDDVIPFFRYPDTSGLGQESQFKPPVNPNTPAGGSLDNDQVLGQDAYGSDTDVTISGLTMPVPDLAVGRLVKTPSEIMATVDHFLALQNGTLPAPSASLVTGYDFLADAADAVHDEFTTALDRPTDRNDRLVTPAGTPYNQSWTATQLKQALLGSRHDLVYLAGHFSANDTLAADFTTTFGAKEIAPNDPVTGAPTPAKGLLTDTLVLSAGCHSGYNIVDSAAVIGQTDTYDWTQAMAQQNAVLIGGTGYQYGDTDFLEYSERLYLGIAQRLREGPAGTDAPPVAVGAALSLAKQDYLASLTTLEGIDQKAVLQATLYGLPMTGFDAPGRSPVRSQASLVPDELDTVGSGPGATLGLSTHDLLDLKTPTTPTTKASGAAGFGLPAAASWRQGVDGVAVQPGAPALPKQVENVTVPDRVLRGVGFRGGDYADAPGLLPLTGAPAIEGSTPKSTFEAPAFWPQRIVTPNYFGALGESGRTSLVLTPAQYRNDPGSTELARTNVERSYRALDLRLYYSGEASTSYGTNQPALATAPAIGEVKAVSNGTLVKFSARVTGDPSAGVQEAWVTWTGTGNDSGHGRWASIDLQQDPDDSTLWTAVRPLPAEQSFEGMRFLVQAVNGIGSVGMDTGAGDGYSVRPGDVVAPTGTLSLVTGSPDSDSPLGVRAKVTDGAGGPALPGRTVAFTVSRDGELLSEYASLTSSDGTVIALFDGRTPSGRLQVRADLYGLDGQIVDTQYTEVDIKGRTLSIDHPWLATRAGSTFDDLTATLLDDDSQPVEGVLVTFKVQSSNGAGATFPGGSTEVSVRTGADGRATAPTITASAAVGSFQVLASAYLARGASVPMASQYAFTPFDAPVDNNGTLTRNPNANTPVAAAALLSDGTRLSDAAAAALVSGKRVQLRWRDSGAALWSTKADLVTYDAADNVFRANLKAPTLNLAKGRTYEVQLRVLATSPQPLGPPLQSDFDLGHRSFWISLK